MTFSIKPTIHQLTSGAVHRIGILSLHAFCSPMVRSQDNPKSPICARCPKSCLYKHGYTRHIRTSMWNGMNCSSGALTTSYMTFQICIQQDVPPCQVSMDKPFIWKVLHAFSNLSAEPKELVWESWQKGVVVCESAERDIVTPMLDKQVRLW